MSVSEELLRKKIDIQRGAYGDDTMIETLTPGEQAIASIIEQLKREMKTAAASRFDPE